MSDTRRPRFAEDTVSDYTPLQLLRRLLAYIHPYRVWVGAALLLSLLSSTFLVIRPYLLKVAVDDYILPGRIGELHRFMLLFVGVYLLRLVSSYLLHLTTGIIGQYIMHDLRMNIFSHILGMEMSFFDHNKVGRLMTRTTDDVATLNELYTSGAVNFINNAGILVGIVAVMFVLDWRLTLVTLVVTPFMYAAAVMFAKKVRVIYRDIRKHTARLNAFMQESIQGIRIIKQMMRTVWAHEKFEHHSDDLKMLKVRNVLYYGMFFPVMEFIGVTGIALILGYGGNRLVAGTIEVGVLIAFFRLVDMFFWPIREMAENFNVMLAAMASSERIFTLLDTKPSIVSPPAPVTQPHATDIEFEHVWFAYNDDDWVLRDVSFTIPAGHRVAFVGPTGSGKSTIMQLILRFYDVQRGIIRVGGVDIREYDTDVLRGMIAHVGQDPFLFNRTVRENITLGSDSVDEKAIMRTMDHLEISDMLGRLEQGLDTNVRERGSRLSLGEKQLISIARAMSADRGILILDEATSSVDTFTDSLLQHAIPHLMEGRTALVIAHRLSTVQTVDTIHVIARGTIKESGTHDELMAHNGIYARLRRMHIDT